MLNREEMRLQEVLDQMTSMFMGQAQAKDLHFEVQGQRSSDQAFYGDSLRLNQILINLLGNAFKFTPGGGCMKLSVEELLSRGGKERVRYRFVVRDSGVGMSPEFLAAEDNALNAEILDELLRMRGGSGGCAGKRRTGGGGIPHCHTRNLRRHSDGCPDAGDERL